MKTPLVFLIAITSTETREAQKTEIVKATFNKHLKGIHYFTDKDNDSIEFAHIEKEVLAKFDLLREESKGEIFMITYTADIEDDKEDNSIIINTIVGLKSVE